MSNIILGIAIGILLVGIALGIAKATAPQPLPVDVRIQEWQAPNGLDRCYVAYYASGLRADIACVEVGSKGD